MLVAENVALNVATSSDEGGSNIYDFCYSDQFCVGFRIVNGASSIFENLIVNKMVLLIIHTKNIWKALL